MDVAEEANSAQGRRDLGRFASGDEHGLPVHRQTLLGRPVHPIMGQSDALTLPREVLAAVVPLGFQASADQKAVVLVERDVPSIEEDVEVGSEQDAIAYAVAAMIGGIGPQLTGASDNPWNWQFMVKPGIRACIRKLP